jgi:hypothetical protein
MINQMNFHQQKNLKQIVNLRKKQLSIEYEKEYSVRNEIKKRIELIKNIKNEPKLS